MACVTAIIQGSGNMPEASVWMLSLIAGIFATLGCCWLGLFNPPHQWLKVPSILILVWSAIGYLGYNAMPKTELEFSAESSYPDPFKSIFEARLKSGPTIDSGYQMGCFIQDITFTQNNHLQTTQSQMVRKGFSQVLKRGETVSDPCLAPIETHFIGDSFAPDKVVCMDIRVFFFSDKTQKEPIGQQRFVAWRSTQFKWHAQPLSGPQDGSYCDYGVP